MMLEFKLNMYFEMYKDKPLPNRDEFRKNFKKKHGKFQYLEELIKMIENYQMKKYGQTLNNYFGERTKEEARKLHIKADARDKYRIMKLKRIGGGKNDN